MLVSHSTTQDPPSFSQFPPLQRLCIWVSPTILNFQLHHTYQCPSPFVYGSIITITTQARISNTMSDTGYFNEKTSLSLKESSSRKAGRNRDVRSCMFRIPWQSEFSPTVLVKDLAERVTSALRLVSLRRCLHRDSSPLGRSKSAAGSSVDSYRTAAIEDCIEFIHSSFSRSNSSTTTSHKDFTHAP